MTAAPSLSTCPSVLRWLLHRLSAPVPGVLLWLLHRLSAPALGFYYDCCTVSQHLPCTAVMKRLRTKCRELPVIKSVPGSTPPPLHRSLPPLSTGLTLPPPPVSASSLHRSHPPRSTGLSLLPPPVSPSPLHRSHPPRSTGLTLPSPPVSPSPLYRSHLPSSIVPSPDVSINIPYREEWQKGWMNEWMKDRMSQVVLVLARQQKFYCKRGWRKVRKERKGKRRDGRVNHRKVGWMNNELMFETWCLQKCSKWRTVLFIFRHFSFWVRTCVLSSDQQTSNLVRVCVCVRACVCLSVCGVGCGVGCMCVCVCLSDQGYRLI